MTDSYLQEVIKKFIEQNIDLIDAGKFEQLYDKLNDYNEDLYHYAGRLTDAFYTANIDPLAGNDVIPDSFLVNSAMTEFMIPPYIRRIQNSAFYQCNLNSIIIPEGVTVIPFECFGESYMDWIQLPKSIVKIEDEAFPSDWMGPIRCYKGSYVEEYCLAHDIKFKYLD